MGEGNQGKRPRKKPAGPAPKAEGPGHLGVDDRGNVTWEWAKDEDLQADDDIGTAERVRALVDPSLGIEEDDDPTNSPIKSNPQGLNRGYNPYSSGALAKQTWKKKKNLKELSKWIELRKKLGEKPPEE